jgi:DNA-binding transcriptional LysR family regulator
MLDARRLAVLAAVIDHGSMSGAAATLLMSPSAVSQQVAALERATGTRLLHRGARGVVATEAGLTLAGHAATVERALRRADADLDDLAALRAGRLRLAAFASAGTRLLPDAVGVFHRAHPGVRMTLQIREPEDCPTPLREGELDLAVVFEHADAPALPTEGLRRRALGDDEAWVALPPGHRLADVAGPVAVTDLRDEPWIRDTGRSCREQLARLCAAGGFEPTIAFDSDDYVTAGRLVLAGVGVALVPDLARDRVDDAVVLRAVRPTA